MKRVLSLIICLLFVTSPAFAVEETEASQLVRVALIDSGISPIAVETERIGKGKNYALSDRDTADVLGHGTALAGLILDTAPDAVLVPLVYCTKTAAGKYVQCSVGTVAQIIRDAVDVYDCQVINISAGVAQDITALREAIAYAEEQGVVVVAAVGNTNRTTPDLCYYPASYDTVIGVGALRKDGKIASFSQRHGVSLVAPGDALKVLDLQGQATTASGTSYAAAQVTGAVAALLAKYPELTPAQVRELLFDRAKDLGEVGFDADSGYGALQAEDIYCT
jgi:subtilisin family serine protease